MPRFDQRERLDEPRAPGFRALAQKPLEVPERLPPLRLGLGIDEVREPLDRGQVEPSVLERAAGELAGFRRPQTFDAAERLEHAGDDRAGAVQLQLGNVLAGLARRGRKPQRERFIEHLA